MPYTTVYLQYSEVRNEDDPYEDDIDEDDSENTDDDDDPEAYSRSSNEDKCFVEFNPIRLTTGEPYGDSIELELTFSVEPGEYLHLVVVRYNNSRSGTLEDWCVEQVFKSGDEAEELVESLEDGLARAECAEDSAGNSVVTKAEVFSMRLHG